MAIDSGLPQGFVIDNQSQSQTQSSDSSLPQGFVLDNQSDSGGYAPQQLTQPAQEFQGSPVSLLDRARIGLMSNQESQVKELSKQFKYVQPMPDGRIAVGNDLNNIKPISSDEFLNDSLGHIADHIKDAVTAAAMTVGAGEGALAARGAGALAKGLAQAAGAGTGAGLVQAGSEAITPDNNIQDAAGRIALQTAFGAATDGLLQGAGMLGNKLVGAKTAKLWGDTLDKEGQPIEASKRPDLAEYIVQGKNPSKAVQVQQKLFQLTGGVDPRNIHSIATFGPEEIYGNPINSNPNTINEVSNGVIRSVKITADKLDSELKDAASALNSSKYNKSNPDMKVDLNSQYQKYLQGLEKDRIGTVQRNDKGDIIGFNFSEYPSVKQDINVHKQFLNELQKIGEGKEQTNVTNIQQLKDVMEGRTQVLPSQLKKIDIGEGLKMEQGFKVFKDDPHIVRFFKTPEDPLNTGVNVGKIDTSLYGEINRIANKVGSQEAKKYISARNSFKEFLQSLDNLKAVGGPELRLQGRNLAGVTEDAAKWLGKSTTIDTAQAKAMDALQSKVPYSFVSPSLKWATANSIKTVNPNFFRFGMLMNFITAPFGHALHAANFLGGLATATPQGLKALTSIGLKRGAGNVASSNIINKVTTSPITDMAKRQAILGILNSVNQSNTNKKR